MNEFHFLKLDSIRRQTFFPESIHTDFVQMGNTVDMELFVWHDLVVAFVGASKLFSELENSIRDLPFLVQIISGERSFKKLIVIEQYGYL